MSTALDALLDELAARVAAQVVERLRGPAPADMVPQEASPLGRRRHCAAVRRRLAAGSGGAAVVGRRHLLSAEAIREELERASKRARATEASPVAGIREQLERELRMVRGGGG
jgi:hypothetical protein